MMSKDKFPLIIAHRGAAEVSYENTMAAFEQAIIQKADMIELDTHLTSDGYFIVHHDKIIKSNNLEYIIAETKLETIESILLPSGDKIPLLEEVLKSLLSSIKFNVEIKCSLTQKQFDDLLTSVGEDTSRIIVSSFLTDVIYELRNTKHNYSLAFLFLFPPLKGKKMAKKDFVSAINPYYRLLSSKHVEFYHYLGKKVFPWTVNNEKDIENLVEKGVDGIITDYPERTRKIVAEYIKQIQ